MHRSLKVFRKWLCLFDKFPGVLKKFDHDFPLILPNLTVFLLCYMPILKSRCHDFDPQNAVKRECPWCLAGEEGWGCLERGEEGCLERGGVLSRV